MLKKLIQVAIMASAVWALNAHGQLYLKIDGVAGEVATNNEFRDQIRVLDWGWGLENAASFQNGGANDGRAFFQDLQLTKFLDSSSTFFYRAVAEGGRASGGPVEREAVLTLAVHVPGAVPPEPDTRAFYIITMQKILVTSLSTSSDDDGQPTENITLNFASYCVEYRRDAQPSSADRTCFDIERNEPLL